MTLLVLLALRCLLPSVHFSVPQHLMMFFLRALAGFFMR
jgi:hypothetical protein